MGIGVKVVNLNKSFGQKHVLHDTCIEIKPAESIAILGGSGTGKSVLLKHIANLIKPDNGKIYINSQDIHSISGKERDKIFDMIGILFQEIGLFDFLNIWQNVAFYYTEVLHYSKQKAKELALDHLDQVGITTASANLSPSETSLGMQKRIGLARVLAHNPELILLDEPTSGLDAVSSGKIGKVILESIRPHKATTITITHDIQLAKTIADRIGLMQNGRFVWVGTPNDLDNSQDSSIRNFIAGIGEDVGSVK